MKIRITIIVKICAPFVLGFLLLLVGNNAYAYRLIQQTGGVGTYTAGAAVPPGSGVTVRWIERTVGYQVNNNGAGDALTFNQTQNAVTAAYNAWQNVSCANLIFVYGGGTAATRNAADLNNVTYWAEAGAPEFGGLAPILNAGVLAVTIITIRNNQTLLDVDVAFNGRDFVWTVGNAGVVRDIQQTATHEIGHMIGFHHTELTSAPLPTMTSASAAGSIAFRTLEVDDRNATCYLYSNFTGKVTGDFNGDGRDDLAIGVGNESIGAILGAGAVNVIYGSSSGLTSTGDQIWHQNTAGIKGGSETNDNFGSALAAGDFNGDGRDDLAIAVMNESIGTIAGAGAVNIIYGSSSGLTATGDQIWHQNTAGIKGGSETNDNFGSALAAGDFNGDGRDDLAIAVMNESIGTIAGAGAVNIIYGSSSGLTATGDQIWHQNTSGIKGGSETNDNFGSALAAGDFNGDGRADLAIGVRNESIGTIAGAGAVNILCGSSSGLTATGDQIWHQNTAGIKGGSETNDSFGSALAAGDFNGDGRADLAIGVRNESIGTIAGAGAVNILCGSSSGLTATGDQIWHQNTAGIKGGAEANDSFGSALAAGDFNGDRRTDLAIGEPIESIGSILGAGAVNVIYGSSSGLTATSDQIWHQNTAGINGGAEADDQFSSSLTSGDFNGNGRADLAIGVRNESIGAIAGAGAVNVIYGTPSGLNSTSDQIWHQNTAGIAGGSEANDSFGGS